MIENVANLFGGYGGKQTSNHGKKAKSSGSFEAALTASANAYSQRTGRNLPLSEEQLHSLAEKYNSTNMTQEELDHFLDDLQNLGYIKEEDKKFAMYHGLSVIPMPEDGISGQPAFLPTYFTSNTDSIKNLSDVNGNALQLFRALASRRGNYDGVSYEGRQFIDHSLSVCSSIQTILEKMNTMQCRI